MFYLYAADSAVCNVEQRGEEDVKVEAWRHEDFEEGASRVGGENKDPIYEAYLDSRKAGQIIRAHVPDDTVDNYDQDEERRIVC